MLADIMHSPRATPPSEPIRYVVLPSLGSTAALVLDDGRIVIPDQGSADANERLAVVISRMYVVPDKKT